MSVHESYLSAQQLASWIKKRKLASIAIAAAVTGGVAGAAIWKHGQMELRKERWREWVVVSTTWSSIGRAVRARQGEDLDPLNHADVAGFIRTLSEERRAWDATRFHWLVNPSPEAWTSSFSRPYDFTCLLAVVESDSGEVAFLLAAYADVSLDGDSMTIVHSTTRDPAISPEGAQRLTEGWVVIDR